MPIHPFFVLYLQPCTSVIPKLYKYGFKVVRLCMVKLYNFMVQSCTTLKSFLYGNETLFREEYCRTLVYSKL